MKKGAKYIGIILITFLMVGVLGLEKSQGGLFDNEEQNWELLFKEIKKMNARLVSMEVGKLKGLEIIQQDIFSQIANTEQKLAGIETLIKIEIITNVDEQLAKIGKQIASQLSQQQIALEQIHAIFKSELIPALSNENDKTRKSILTSLEGLKEELKRQRSP